MRGKVCNHVHVCGTHVRPHQTLIYEGNALTIASGVYSRLPRLEVQRGWKGGGGPGKSMASDGTRRASQTPSLPRVSQAWPRCSLGGLGGGAGWKNRPSHASSACILLPQGPVCSREVPRSPSFPTQVPSRDIALSAQPWWPSAPEVGPVYTQGSRCGQLQPHKPEGPGPWARVAGNTSSDGCRVALLSWQHCALASCQQARSDTLAGRAPGQPVLAAPPPACEGDFTLTSYLQSDVRISYAALSSARREGGALSTAGRKDSE